MSRILILEERIYPSSVGKDVTKILHHQSMVKAISKLENVFDFEYALDVPVKEKDFDKVSLSLFKKSVDEDRLFDILVNYEVVILQGSNLCEYILDKKLNKYKNSIVEMSGISFIPTYSARYSTKNHKSLDEAYKLAFDKLNGDIVSKDFCSYEIIKTLDRLQEVVELRHITNICSFDFETYGLEYYDKSLKATVLAITYQPGHSYLIPFEHKEFSWGDQLPQMLQILSIIFSDETITKIAHNLKFDLHWLRRYGITEWNGRFCDTMLMHHILDENTKHGLKLLVKTYFPFWFDYDANVDFNGPLEQLCKYAAIDSDVTLRLFYIFENELLKDGHFQLYRLLRNMVIPALFNFEDIEYRGCYINKNLINESITKAEKLLKIKADEINAFPEVLRFVKYKNTELINKEIIALEDKIKKREDSGKLDTDKYIVSYKSKINELKTGQILMYDEVNFNSPKQVVELLYEKVGFHFAVPKVNFKQVKSSAKDALQEINHPFILKLFSIRTIKKMISTYYEGLLSRLSHTDKVHGSFLQHGTVTGRLSSRNPNLQNIPGRLSYDDDKTLEVVKVIKKFFKAPDDDTLVLQVDLSQAELRTIANIANDPMMIQAYSDNKDLHAITGARMVNMSFEDFLKHPDYFNIRTGAKGANFGLVFKASNEGYIQYVKKNLRIDISMDVALAHRKAVFGTYTQLAVWHKRYEHLAKKNNYVETLFGRRRRFKNINNTTNVGLINKDIRDAINMPIQGTSGEYTVMIMTLLYHRLPSYCKMWSTVHDSIFFYIPKEPKKLEYCIDIINRTSEDIELMTYFNIRKEKFPVPMKMDYEMSDVSWGHMEEIGNYDKTKEFLAKLAQ